MTVEAPQNQFLEARSVEPAQGAIVCQIYTHPLHAEEGAVATPVACMFVFVEN